MSNRFEHYATARDELLRAITDFLQNDERFVAAWLGGSFGRGDEDDLSDLDLFVVVADEYSDAVCRRERHVAAGTTDERLAIFSQVGPPVIIHENHNNAPAGGTMTAVIYEGTVQQVDWTLIPQSVAQRPVQSMLLFEQATIPARHPIPVEDEAERLYKLNERHTFFWMMTVPTAKYAMRGDSVYFHILFDMLHRTAEEVERLLNRKPWEYQRGSPAAQSITWQQQISALAGLCVRMQELDPRLREAGVHVTEPPMPTIQRLLDMGYSDQDT